MVTSKVWIKKEEFDGQPKQSDFELIEEELAPLQNGQFLIEAEYLSVDPYTRVFDIQLGTILLGSQIAK